MYGTGNDLTKPCTPNSIYYKLEFYIFFIFIIIIVTEIVVIIKIVVIM